MITEVHDKSFLTCLLDTRQSCNTPAQNSSVGDLRDEIHHRDCVVVLHRH